MNLYIRLVRYGPTRAQNASFCARMCLGWGYERCSPKFWQSNRQKVKFWADEYDFPTQMTKKSNT